MNIDARLIERAAVLGELRERLSSVGRVVLWGAAGTGRTTLLNTVVDESDAVALRAHLSEAYAGQAYAAVTDLLSAVPGEILDGLGEPRRAALSALLRQSGRDPAPDRIAVRLAVLDAFGALSAGRRVLVAVDDAQHLDEGSADVLRFVCRNLRPGRLAVLFATTDPALVAEVCGSPCQELMVPGWSVAEIAELLAGVGLPTRLAGRIHAAAGGNPALALRIAGALGTRPPRAPLPAPPEIGAAARRSTRRGLAALPRRARETLLLAALAERPTVRLLRACGRRQIHEDLTAAAAAGLLSLDGDGGIRFSAGLVADTLRVDAAETAVASAHRALAAAVSDQVAAAHHRALSTDAVSEPIAERLDEAAETAQRRGDRRRAAALSMLAAERTPPAHTAAAVRRYRAAARQAALAGDTELTQRAADAVLDRATDPADRVRARLSIMEVAGQAFDVLDEVFADAETHAAGRPELLGEVRLWLAWRAHLRDGDTRAAARLAREAVDLAEQAGDRAGRGFLVEALATVARFQFLCGEPGSDELLARAEELSTPDEPASPHGAPGFVRARLALFDDRLTEARDDLLRLLPVAQRLGEMKALVEVWRSLAEVELRAGRCGLARDYARRAIAHVSDSEGSPGSALYAASLVEASCGDLDMAESYARQGLRSSREDHDIWFTANSLYALGRVQLAVGEVTAAVDSLRKVQTLHTAFEVSDPSVLHWHAELVEALAIAGELSAAAEICDKSRAAAVEYDRRPVLAELDRAEAAVLVGNGDLDAAAGLLHSAREVFAARGLPLEEGRALLSLAHVERRRRRRSAARATLIEAEEIFTRCEAAVWLESTARERARLEPASAPGPADARLTPAEARVAELVAAGASNSEVAARLFVSVKTVEATLTRVYRKLGVRSRGQLAATGRPRE
ncbi:helix-turn-helix transcriptional regulator [Phytomonospora endophytica]|uniref:DNA-binding CsgD family transcriptional regulator n=1 Tax=Phytomonospora endophytica TaxID=714109 RepID=A0A841FIH5_9ACTN|nr:LuxR family transcriptional regulator [Phytomonospora endophytica]MBB6035565.1 DNA-binding CsgD family transcriptional regulator [Phytomonospora endophytica]GIG70072.1 transcriptional regulator [Phytomonospora endophytica]